MRLSAIVVAPGQSSRLRSARPAPLHVLCGQPLALYAMDALDGVTVDRIALVASGDGEQVAKKLSERAADPRLSVVETPMPRGSAPAVATGLASLFADPLDEGDLVVLPGNAPLLRPETIAAFVAAHRKGGAAATVLTIDDPDPDEAALRVVVDRHERIVAVAADAEIYEGTTVPLRPTGVYCFRQGLLSPALRRVRLDALTGEERLDDVIAVLAGTGHTVASHRLADPTEALTVTDRAQLATAEAAIRLRVNRHWLERGVSMVDPARTYLDTTVSLGTDVTLFPGVILQGETVVGPGAEIGPDTRLVDCAIGADAVVEKTMARDAEIGAGAHVGPFAVLDAGTQIPPGFDSGPFYHADGHDKGGA